MPHPARPAPSALLLLALAAACGPGTPPDVAARDSAGVALVTSTAAATSAAPRWRLADTARVELGEGGRVAAAAWRPDGTFAVARGGEGGVRLHAADGRRGPAVATPGAVDWLAAAGDSLLVHDPAAASVAVVGAEGRLARRFPLPAGGVPAGLFGDGTLLVRVEGGAPGDSALHLRVSRAGAPLDTLGRLPRGTPAVAHGPGVWYAAAGRPAVERLSRRGIRVRSVRWAGGEVPAAAALVPAGDDELWVRGPHRARADSADWLVLRGDGRVRARLRLPAATRVLAVSGESALVAEPGTDGEDRVRVRDVRQP